MTTTAIHGPAARNLSQSVLGLAAAPFLGFGRLLISLAESSRRGQEVGRLNRLSDADLAARGLTREGEIRRIFSTPSHN